MAIIFNSKYDLIYALINEIGLSINENRDLYDQDSMIMIKYGNKPIKCSIDPNRPVYVTNQNSILDPISDGRIMNMFLSYYLEKERAYGNINSILFYSNEPDGRKGPSSITIKADSGEITSRLYNNKCLKFADIILRIGGQDVDLSNFDSLEAVM